MAPIPVLVLYKPVMACHKPVMAPHKPATACPATAGHLTATEPPQAVITARIMDMELPTATMPPLITQPQVGF